VSDTHTALPWPERLSSKGPKRILSIDGGGLRGALAVGMLRKVEQTLRDQFDRKDLLLADYFDLIGGTSTGAIIAAALAIGYDTERIEGLYRSMGPKIFSGSATRVPLLQTKFNPKLLERVLREELGEFTLGNAPWKTGFAAVAKRIDTASAWILTNNPKARYWEGDPDEKAAGKKAIANRDFPLHKVVQASAAAPFYFDLVPIDILEGQRGIFFDGGITPHGNPVLQLVMSALIPAYGYGWEAGADKLLVVSLGTGVARNAKPQWLNTKVAAVLQAMQALISLTQDTSRLAVSVLQWLGTSPQPWHINSEVGDLDDARPNIPPLWTFLRYDAPLEPPWLKANLNLEYAPAALEKLHRMDEPDNVEEWFKVGMMAGDLLVRPEHFPKGFMQLRA
jgi:predicted patatin/cPLA2 family phospholipase